MHRVRLDIFHRATNDHVQTGKRTQSAEANMKQASGAEIRGTYLQRSSASTIDGRGGDGEGGGGK